MAEWNKPQPTFRYYPPNLANPYILPDKKVFNKGVATDDKGIYYRLLKSTKQGNNVYNQYELGLIYYYGKGTEINLEEAFGWITKSAEQGYEMAQYLLSYMYYYGEGTEINYKKSFAWLTKSAEKEYANAQYRLGFMYLTGQFVSKSISKAQKWFTRAADLGHIEAKDQLRKLK